MHIFSVIRLVPGTSLWRQRCAVTDVQCTWHVYVMVVLHYTTSCGTAFYFFSAARKQRYRSCCTLTWQTTSTTTTAVPGIDCRARRMLHYFDYYCTTMNSTTSELRELYYCTSTYLLPTADGSSSLYRQLQRCSGWSHVLVYICTKTLKNAKTCLLYTSPSPRDQRGYRMPSSA